MDVTKVYSSPWKVVFKRGEGEAVIYGNSEIEARNAALAAYRKRKTMVDFLSADDIIETIEYIGD